MRNNKSNILIWLLTWAILFVVVIYSPIGSPELYTQDNYVSYYQGVNFSSGIANSPKLENYKQYEGTSSIVLPTYKATTTTKTYTVNQLASSEKTIGQANYRVSAYANNRTNTRTTTFQNRDSVGAYAYLNSHRKNELAYSTPQTVDVSSLSTDLAINNPSITTRELVDPPIGGGTDPGGDPTGDPIPVGDGFFALLIMLSLYAFWKRMV